MLNLFRELAYDKEAFFSRNVTVFLTGRKLGIMVLLINKQTTRSKYYERKS